MSEDIPFELTDGACCPECGTKMVPCTHSAAESEPWWCAECGFNEPVDAQAPASGEVEPVAYDGGDVAAMAEDRREKERMRYVPERLLELAYEEISDAAAEAQEGGEYCLPEWVQIVTSSDWPPHPPAKVPEGVSEALQRLIENSESMGPASREDALLVAKHRHALLTTPTPATTAETDKEYDPADDPLFQGPDVTVEQALDAMEDEYQLDEKHCCTTAEAECEPDLMWDAESPEESCADSAYEFADDRASDMPVDETMVVNVMCAKMLPSRKMKIWIDENEDLQWEWITPPQEQ